MVKIEDKVLQIASFLDYNAQLIIPKTSEYQSAHTMDGVLLNRLLRQATNSQLDCSRLPPVGREKDVDEIASECYNDRAFDRIAGLEEEERELASIILQSIIRKKNTRFVFTNILQKKISSLPKQRKRGICCCIPKKPIELPFVDYSIYCNEEDWMQALSKDVLQTLPKESLFSLMLSIQLQMLAIEDRLVNSDKVHLFCSNNV